MTDYAALRQFCNTPRQAEIIETILECGSISEAARELGVRRQSIQNTLRGIERIAVKRGMSPEHDMVHPVPDGYHVKGTSTYYGPDGKPRGQWVKSAADKEERDRAMREYLDGLTAEIAPKKRTKTPKTANKYLLSIYPIGDHHFGMYATVGDGGGDYNLDIAKTVLADAVDYLVDNSPPSHTALLINLGDFIHTDNKTNLTPRGKNVLDTTGQYWEICRVAGFAMAHSIDRLLQKHKRVHVINCPGNHDEYTANWLSLFLMAYYRKEPRVEIDMTAGDWFFYQFGDNMVCATHGHQSKLEQIPGIMANLAPEMWGSTWYRYALTGHIHHSVRNATKEDRGAITEAFGILAPADEYARNKGYRSVQEMCAITLKKTGGQLCRLTYNV